MLASLSTVLISAAVAASDGPSKGYLEYQDQMSHLAVLFWIAVISIPFVIVAMLFLVVWLFTRKSDRSDSPMEHQEQEGEHHGHH